MSEVTTQVDLEEAIEQLINLGEKDPLTIARKLIERNGQEWVEHEVVARAEDYIQIIARMRLGTRRRSAEVALRPGDERSQIEFRVSSVWVPVDGWMPASEVTSAMLREKASFYGKLADAAIRRKYWYLEVADLMDAQGAVTLAEYQGDLPPLPGVEETPELS